MEGNNKNEPTNGCNKNTHSRKKLIKPTDSSLRRLIKLLKPLKYTLRKKITKQKLPISGKRVWLSQKPYSKFIKYMKDIF